MVQTSRRPEWFGTLRIQSPRRRTGPGIKRRVRDDKCFMRRSELTISSGLTGYLSSVLEDFTTFPLLVTFLAFFSFAFLICGVLGMVKCAGVGVSVRKYSSLLTVAAVLFTGAVDLLLELPTLQTQRTCRTGRAGSYLSLSSTCSLSLNPVLGLGLKITIKKYCIFRLYLTLGKE